MIGVGQVFLPVQAAAKTYAHGYRTVSRVFQPGLEFLVQGAFDGGKFGLGKGPGFHLIDGPKHQLFSTVEGLKKYFGYVKQGYEAVFLHRIAEGSAK